MVIQTRKQGVPQVGLAAQSQHNFNTSAKKNKDNADLYAPNQKTAMGDSATAGFPGVSNEKPVGSFLKDDNSPYARKNDALRNRSYQRVA